MQPLLRAGRRLAQTTICWRYASLSSQIDLCHESVFQRSVVAWRKLCCFRILFHSITSKPYTASFPLYSLRLNPQPRLQPSFIFTVSLLFSSFPFSISNYPLMFSFSPPSFSIPPHYPHLDPSSLLLMNNTVVSKMRSPVGALQKRRQVARDGASTARLIDLPATDRS